MLIVDQEKRFFNKKLIIPETKVISRFRVRCNVPYFGQLCRPILGYTGYCMDIQIYWMYTHLEAADFDKQWLWET